MPNTPAYKPTTETGKSFAAWVADRRPLTPEEISDIQAQIQPAAAPPPTPQTPAAAEPERPAAPTTLITKMLPPQQWPGPEGSFALLEPSTETKQIKPTTPFGKEFTEWLTKREALTTKETADLKAQLDASKKAAEEAAKKAAKPTVPPELLIARTPYPKWWKTLRTAPISVSGAGSQAVVPAQSGFSLYIATIVFTVSDETNISLTFGVFGSSGAMDFGGENEPRGMVISMGESPAPCGEAGFTVTSDGGGATVGGFATYYLEKLKETK